MKKSFIGCRSIFSPICCWRRSMGCERAERNPRNTRIRNIDCPMGMGKMVTVGALTWAAVDDG